MYYLEMISRITMPDNLLLLIRGTRAEVWYAVCTVNLAEGLPSEEIMLWLVRRSDGTYEKYFLPVGKGDEYRHLLNLGPQDKIVQAGCLGPLPPSTPHIPEATKVP
jgi:hypothetical protein